jgi:hypothetical protein
MLRASVFKGSVWVVWHALRQAVQEIRQEFNLPLPVEKADLRKMKKAEAARKRARQSP